MTSDDVRSALYARYASWHAGASPNAAAAAVFRRDILPFLPADRGARVLDVGCGQGALVAELHRAGYWAATGVDVSPEQVALAHERGIMAVQQADYATVLVEREGQLDVVTATDFFEHLTKPEVVEAFRRIRLALRPGGCLIGRCPNAVSPFAGNYQEGDFTHETSFTARSIRQVALSSGFDEVMVRPCPPVAHGLRSGVRRAIWAGFSGVFKLALASETGVLAGHIVTQNLVFVARRREGWSVG